MVTSEVEWFYPGIGTWKTQQRHWSELTFRLFRFALFCNFGPRPIGTPLSIRIIKEHEMNTPTPAQALCEVRDVDGMKVAFVPHESYFAGLHTESMYSTSKRTGADMVLLLGEGKAHTDLSDDDIRELIAAFLAASGETK